MAGQAHYCPGCGKVQTEYLRYPWYFCRECLQMAEDWQGRQLVFGNVSISGGLTWAFKDEPESIRTSDTQIFCFINGRPVLVTEARFGGVVAQPCFNARPGGFIPKAKDLTVAPPPGKADETKGAPS